MDKKDIERSIHRMTANFALEGIIATDEDISNCYAILAGKITADELVEAVIAKNLAEYASAVNG